MQKVDLQYETPNPRDPGLSASKHRVDFYSTPTKLAEDAGSSKSMHLL